MAAITWRNVDAPNLGDPTRTGMLASNSINNAFDILNKQLTTAQAVDSQNWDARKALNTDQYLSRLQSFKTPEEAAAAQADLQAMRQGFQAQIDMPVVRNAEANLTENLQRRVTTNNAYVTSQEDFAERDPVARMKQFIYAGDMVGYQKALAENPNLSNRARAALAAEATQAQRAADLHANAMDDQKIQREQLELQRRQLAIQASEAAARRNEQSRVRAEANALKLAQAEAQGNAATVAQAQAAREHALKNGRLASGTLDTVEGKATLLKALKDSYGMAPEDAAKFVTRIEEGYPGGKFKVRANGDASGKVIGEYGLPVTDVLNAISRNKDNLHTGWILPWDVGGVISSPRTDATKELAKTINSPGFLEDYEAQLRLRDQGAMTLLGAIERRGGVIPPGKGSTPPKR